MIIDAWAQHPTLRHASDPIFDSLRRWTGSEAPTEELPVAVTVGAMDQAGVDRALISAWYAPHRSMISNDDVAGFVAEAPDRLDRRRVSVDISRPMEAVREIHRCVEELGFVAIRVLPWLWDLEPTDRRFYPVYVACCELGVPFCTQIGHTGPLMPSDVGRPIHLDRVAIDFPDLTIVGGHIGYPWTEEAIAVATKHPSTSTSTPRPTPPTATRQALVDYLKTNGSVEGAVRHELPDDHAGQVPRAPRPGWSWTTRRSASSSVRTPPGCSGSSDLELARVDPLALGADRLGVVPVLDDHPVLESEHVALAYGLPSKSARLRVATKLP